MKARAALREAPVPARPRRAPERAHTPEGPESAAARERQPTVRPQLHSLRLLPGGAGESSAPAPSPAPPSRAPPTTSAAPTSSEPAPAAAAATHAFLDAGLESERVPLPHEGAVRSTFGSAMPEVAAHSGPTSQALLGQMGANAASRGNTILLADPAASTETVIHEVAHVVDAQRPGAGPAATPVLPGESSAEQRAGEAVAAVKGGRSPMDALGPSAPAPGGAAGGGAGGAAGGPAPLALERASAGAAPAAEASARTSSAPTQSGSASPAGRGPSAPRASTEGETVSAGAEATRQGAATPGEQNVGALAAPEQTAGAAGGGTSEALPAAEALPNDTIDGYLSALTEASPTQKALAQATIGAQIDAAASKEQAVLAAAAPTLQVKLDGSAAPAAKPLVTAPTATVGELEAQAPAAVSLAPPAATPDPGRYTANAGVAGDFTRSTSAGSLSAADVSKGLDQVSTTDPGIVSTPGPAPTVPREGELDPARLAGQQATAATQTATAQAEATTAVVQGRGPEAIQAVTLDETVSPKVPDAPAPGGPAASPRTQAYLDAPLPADVRAKFDEQNQAAMQAGMAQTQAAAAKATADRDTQKDKAITDAQTANATAIVDAQTAQNTEVEDRRKEVQEARADTLEQQQDAVSDLHDDADAERSKQDGAIGTRVKEDEGKIGDRYDQAEADSDKEIKKGEEKAEAKKNEAEKDAEEKSWWDKAVDFVASALSALADALGKVFDLVRSAVKGILDAAKTFAHSVIDAAATFIKGAIEAYGTLLKGLVNTLLADTFPGLAKALNSVIDGAVDLASKAVDLVADGLKKAVDFAADGLFAAFDAVLSAYEGAIKGALTFLEAAVTGDWDKVFQMMLEAALSLAGIAPEEFYAFIGRAEETFTLIVNDPGAFVGNLLDAFFAGVRQFGDNFLTHLQTGVISWLTGSLTDIQIPATWDLMGVLDLLRQILGLTYDRLREKAVNLIGEQNVARIEFVASYLKTLIDEGWGGLWERIKADLANLATSVLTAIGEFLVAQVVKAAVVKLVSWLSLYGGVVDILLTLWNFYTFVRAQAQRMFQIIKTIVDGIGDIARGTIKPAADKVEGTLGNLIPIALDMLAKLLGLGDIPAKVREIIGNVRKTVDGAIDKLINWVIGIFKGGGAPAEEQAAPGPQAAADGDAGGDINISLPLHLADGEHTLRMDMVGGKHKLMVHTRVVDPKNAAAAADLTALTAAEEKAETAADEYAATERDDTPETEAHLDSLKHTVQTESAVAAEIINKNPGGGAGGDKLKEITSKAELIKTLKAIATPNGWEGIDSAALGNIWLSEKPVRDHLKALFREGGGEHEWIPTNYLPKVVEAVAKPEELVNVGHLVTYQDSLRSPTWQLVFAQRAETVKQVGGRTVLQGHVGAVYLNAEEKFDSTKQQVTGQYAFHEALRKAFDSTPKVPEELDKTLRGVAEAWVWKGETVTNPNKDMLFRGNGNAMERLSDREGGPQNTIFNEQILGNFATALGKAKAS